MSKSTDKTPATIPENRTTESCTALNSSMAATENVPMMTITADVSWKHSDGSRVDNPVTFGQEFPARLGNLSDGAAMVGDWTLDVATAIMMLQHVGGESSDLSIEFNIGGKESVFAIIPYPEEIFADEDYFFTEDSILDEIRENIRDAVQSEVVHAIAYSVLLAIEG